MDIDIHSAVPPRSDPEAAPAFCRDTLGPPDQPDVSVVKAG